MVSWLKTHALDLESQSSSPTSVRDLFSFPCLTSMPWSSLSSTQSNEEVFHRILWRGSKAVGPGGPGSISLRLFQALVSHYYSGKPERVKKNTGKLGGNFRQTTKETKLPSLHILPLFWCFYYCDPYFIIQFLIV